MPTAYNPSTGETLELVNDQWVPAEKGSSTPKEPPKIKAGETILAYNPATKQQMEYNQESGKWEEPSLTTRLKQDISHAAKKYGTMDTAERVAKGFLPQNLAKSAVGAVAGGAEALAGGVAGMAEQAGAGVSGLVQGALDTFHGGKFSDGFTKGYDRVETAWNDLVGDKLEPTTELGKAFNEALGLIPKAVQKAGDVTFEATGSPIIGAGTQALATLLMLKPDMATKALKGTWDKVGPKGTQPVQEHFAKLVEETPEAAQSITNHVSDKVLKKELQERIDSVTMNKERLAKITDPKNYKEGMYKPQGIEVTKSDLEEMFSPKRFAKEAKMEEDAKVELAKSTAARNAEEIAKSTPRQQHELAKSNLQTRVTTQAIPDGQWLNPELGKGDTAQHIGALSIEFKRALFGKQGGGIVPGGEAYKGVAPTVMSTERLASIRDKNRRIEPKTTTDAPGGVDDVKRSILQKGVHTPVTVTISTKDGRAYLTDGNTRVTAAAELGLKGVPVKLEKTEVPFTKEQLMKSKPLNQLGLTLDMVPEKVRTAREIADRAELRKLLGTGDSDVVMMNSVLGPLTPEATKKAHEWMRESKHFREFEEGVKTDVEQIIRTISPESLGPVAKRAAAVIGNGIAGKARLDMVSSTNATLNKKFWMAKEVPEHLKFIEGMEKGAAFADPMLESLRQQYKARNEQVYQFDKSKGLTYEPVDNYMYHLWKNPAAAEHFFTMKYGADWNKPKFIKERGWDLYKEGIEKGKLEPLHTNPEDIMLAREYASHLMGMRVDVLNDLVGNGVAIRKVQGKPQPLDTTGWRSPSGDWYWVHNDASQILHNAFDTKSLWGSRGIPGQAFRGWMHLKNKTTPILLSLSAFHPLHIALGMDFGANMVRSTKELVAGTQSPLEFIKNTVKDATGPGLVERSRSGFKLVDVWKGKVPEGELTIHDKAALQVMAEGGFTPLQSHEWNSSARDNFTAAVRRHSMSAGWHAPWALLEAVNAPIFEKWIPALKSSSYLADCVTALKTDPTLAENRGKRMEVFRNLAKSTDNRFGEMNYNQLFWNRTIRDAGVASTLSMGWTLGFLREYGGAGIELSKLSKSGDIRKAVTKGELDKAMFVGYYTASALAVGGLITYAMTGKAPQELKDYIYPKSGEKLADGKEKRLNTMFYTREFAGLYEHIQSQGAMSGISQFAVNKAAPVFSMVGQMFTNLDFMNKEISDPNAPAFKQLEQKLSYLMGDMSPISLEAAKGETTVKGKVMSIAGFGPAPAYATETHIEGKIKHMSGYYNKHVTPYEKAQYSGEVKKLHNAAKVGDTDKYMEALQTLKEKYDLSSSQLTQIQKQSRTDPTVNMFRRLSVDQQVKLLKEMSQEDLQKFFTSAHPESKKKYQSLGGK